MTPDTLSIARPGPYNIMLAWHVKQNSPTPPCVSTPSPRWGSAAPRPLDPHPPEDHAVAGPTMERPAEPMYKAYEV